MEGSQSLHIQEAFRWIYWDYSMDKNIRNFRLNAITHLRLELESDLAHLSKSLELFHWHKGTRMTAPCA